MNSWGTSWGENPTVRNTKMNTKTTPSPLTPPLTTPSVLVMPTAKITINIAASVDKYPTIDTVSCKYGAPMGRNNWYGTPELRSVRVFEVPINSQGYDRGGAYWGIGERLFCATDGNGFRKFTRAKNRSAACVLMEIDKKYLKKV